MITTLSTVFGGIGLFLLGMVLLTDGLKALAGEALRDWLARFTGSRASAVASGAALTALVQSSSATTLATIGFVSAGLLSFNNAIGVIIGANLGTTSTGWIVSLLGLKLSIGKLALPLIGFGALARLLGRERLAQAGTALAGFGVIFVGIDVLQAGMAGLAEHIDLSRHAADGLGARLMLVAIGVVMTVLMQSSSAAVATTLTALSTGTIGLDQAAALVIGQNIGTTVTAGIAAIGAQAAAKRTALIHVVFNGGTGLVAFLILPLFIAGVDHFTEDWIGDDHALSLAAFHTAFNLLGALIFVPLIPQLARLAQRLVPEPANRLTRHLDESLLTVPAVALDAAGRAAGELTTRTVQALQLRLASGQPVNLVPLREGVASLTGFLSRLQDVEPQRLPDWLKRLQQIDDLDRLLRRLGDETAVHALLESQTLAPQRAALLARLRDFPAQPLTPALSGGESRTAILEQTAQRMLTVNESVRALSGQRLLEDWVASLERLRSLAEAADRGRGN